MRVLAVLISVLAACGDNLAVTPDAAEPPPAVFTQTAYVKSTQPLHDAHFGELALSAAGDTLVAAQPEAVSVYVHDETWRVEGDLARSSEGFGTHVAISGDGSTIAVSADLGSYSVCCAVYVFRRVGTAWIEEAHIIAGGLATSLALSSDGNTLVIGTRNAMNDVGRVYTYERREDAWSQLASVGGGPDDYHFGSSLALAADGSVFAANAYRLGANGPVVEVFVRTDDAWLLQATLASPNPRPAAEFGSAISCSARCETIAIGDFEPPPPAQITDPGGAGVAYVFDGDGTAWTPTAKLEANNAEIGDKFGIAVAISGDGSTIVIGAPSESSAATGINGDGAINGAPYAGAAYVFRRYLDAWWQAGYLKGSNTESLDIFGSRIAIAHDGTAIAVAAPFESSGSAGVDGDQTDNSQPYAGAIYTFAATYE